MSRSTSSTSPPPGLATHLIARSDIQYDESKLLGQGGYGAVFRGTRKGGARVAVKRLLQGLTESSKFAFQREVAIMSSMSCEFVVQIYGVVDDSPDQPVLLVMELMHQSLYQAYKSMPPPSLRQRIMWLIQAGKGIAFLHAGGVIHRDVKPNNMLISAPDKGQTLKMGDFGLSKSLSDITLASSRAAHAAVGLGTPNYMAPELLVLRPKYSPASDVFAFGVVVWELYCMKLPFADCKDMHLLMAEVRNGEREEFPPDMPAALRTMIERAWHQDPSQRPSIEQCVFDLEAMLVQDLSPDTAIAAPPPPTLHHSVPETHRPPADSGIPKHLAIEMPTPDSTPIDQQQVCSVGPAYTAYAPLFTANCISGVDVFDDDCSAERLSQLFSGLKIEDTHRMVLVKRFQIWKQTPVDAFTAVASAAAGGSALARLPRGVGVVAAVGVGFLRALNIRCAVNGAFSFDPYGLAFDHEGNVIVTSCFGIDVFRCSDWRCLRSINLTANFVGHSPWGVALDCAGHLVVTLNCGGCAVVLNYADGSYVRTIGSPVKPLRPGLGPEQLGMPSGVTIDVDGNIVVHDGSLNGRIQIFRMSDGAHMRTIGTGTLRGGYGGVAFDAEGNLVVSDCGNHCIRVFRYSDGQLLRTIGQEGAGNGQFKTPVDFALDGAGHLVVVEQGNSRVQVLNYADGSHVRTIGSQGSGDGQFKLLFGGIVIDSDGHIFICDRDNNRIQVLQ